MFSTQRYLSSVIGLSVSADSSSLLISANFEVLRGLAVRFGLDLLGWMLSASSSTKLSS